MKQPPGIIIIAITLVSISVFRIISPGIYSTGQTGQWLLLLQGILIGMIIMYMIAKRNIPQIIVAILLLIACLLFMVFNKGI